MNKEKQIKEIIRNAYKLSEEKLNEYLTTQTKTNEIVEVRHLYRYIMRKLLNSPLRTIAEKTSQKKTAHHSTIINSVEQVQAILEYKHYDPVKERYSETIDQCQELLTNSKIQIKKMYEEICRDISRLQVKQHKLKSMVSKYYYLNK